MHLHHYCDWTHGKYLKLASKICIQFSLCFKTKFFYHDSSCIIIFCHYKTRSINGMSHNSLFHSWYSVSLQNLSFNVSQSNSISFDVGCFMKSCHLKIICCRPGVWCNIWTKTCKFRESCVILELERRQSGRSSSTPDVPWHNKTKTHDPTFPEGCASVILRTFR